MLKTPEYAFALDVLVDLYLARNQLDEAERAARRALAIRESAAVPDRLEIAKNATNLATILNAAAEYAEAEPNARKALDLREQSLKPDHPRIAESLNNVAVLLFRQGASCRGRGAGAQSASNNRARPRRVRQAGETPAFGPQQPSCYFKAEHRRSEADAFNHRALGVAQPLEHKRQKKIEEGSPPPSVEASMLGKNSYLFGCGRNWGQVLVSARDQTEGRDVQPSDRDRSRSIMVRPRQTGHCSEPACKRCIEWAPTTRIIAKKASS